LGECNKKLSDIRSCFWGFSYLTPSICQQKCLSGQIKERERGRKKAWAMLEEENQFDKVKKTVIPVD